MGTPRLDYKHPLHKFDNQSGTGHGLSFTADKDCYLYGQFSMTSIGTNVLTIDDLPIGNALLRTLGGSTSGATECVTVWVDTTLIPSGSVVETTSEAPLLYILEEL